jgi:membrane-associated phospholipid phosphatase
MNIKKILLSLTLLSSLFSPVIAKEKKDFTRVGDILQVAIPTAGAALTAYNRDLDGFWQLGQSMLINQVTVELMKRGIKEERPNGGKYSFPSGHTAAAFAGAAFIHKRYGIEKGLPAYLFAGVVGASRLNNNAHWTQDVAFGAILGFMISHFSTTPFNNSDIQVSPVVVSQSPGIQLGIEF